MEFDKWVGTFLFLPKFKSVVYREVVHSVAPGHQQRQTQEISQRQDFWIEEP